jgi:hypothetical protein
VTSPLRFERGMRVRLTCAPFDCGVVMGVERRGDFGIAYVVVRWCRAFDDVTTVTATVLEAA